MSKAKISAASARLQLAIHALEKATIKAPVDGTVLEVNSRLGELASPDAGQPCLLLADMSTYRVRAFVEEIDAPRVVEGMRVEVTADGMVGKSFIGHITRLSPRMSPKQIWSDDPAESFDTKTREVWIDLEAGQGQLVLGLRVDVTILPAVKVESNEVARQ